ncbi:Lipid-binding SYLF domain-containing protein [Desulfacinum hydrothermale DSM 13146]|uniref:Lipid-binding SYLF domain-containing protein n=1 Tax=Desulfacinum hydrothermale DSM 13146 TaxID=1121390 RepID=A0A1W1WZM1_9BACT|nr:lipid-binding SYLF domain-containing protein [Desulfacinum hydrothermale]SMC17186.1 Lipid-binding SYLF domain-containing protein [Desulfacinum hydrothermale DSM 13146]
MKRKVVLIMALALALALGAFAPATAEDSISKPETLVEEARLTLQSLTSDPNFSWLTTHLKDAQGVLIIPQFLKGGFIIGGSGGSGVLLVRDRQSGQWSQPVFYTLGGLSIGLQMGGEAAQVILMVRTQRGVDALMTSGFKLGGDAAVAAGPIGMAMEGATPHNLSADFLSFAKAKGAYAGMSLEGAIVKVRNDWNEQYYGKPVSPTDIVVTKAVSNPHSAALRAVLGAVARR